MTQIGGFVAPTRRPGELGVHSVDLFSIAVPDLAEAACFKGVGPEPGLPQSDEVIPGNTSVRQPGRADSRRQWQDARL